MSRAPRSCFHLEFRARVPERPQAPAPLSILSSLRLQRCARSSPRPCPCPRCQPGAECLARLSRELLKLPSLHPASCHHPSRTKPIWAGLAAPFSARDKVTASFPRLSPASSGAGGRGSSGSRLLLEDEPCSPGLSPFVLGDSNARQHPARPAAVPWRVWAGWCQRCPCQEPELVTGQPLPAGNAGARHLRQLQLIFVI